jgi:hypothetical protein
VFSLSPNYLHYTLFDFLLSHLGYRWPEFRGCIFIYSSVPSVLERLVFVMNKICGRAYVRISSLE